VRRLRYVLSPALLQTAELPQAWRSRCAPAKKAYARRKEEERWVKAAGEVKTVYRCICDKNLEMFKAEEHPKRIKTT